jgi:hypothetical protein
MASLTTYPAKKKKLKEPAGEFIQRSDLKKQVTLQTLYVRFNRMLEYREIPDFVEAVGKALDKQDRKNPKKEFFFNRMLNADGTSSNKPKFKYARINFRVHKEKATLFAIGEGVPVLTAFLNNELADLRLRDQKVFAEETIKNESFQPKLLTGKERRCYHINSYVALNQENHKEWLKLEDAVAQIKFLETLLISHLHGWTQEMNWLVDKKKIRIRILDFVGRHVGKIKVNTDGNPIKKLAFEFTYETNLLLPEHIALGGSIRMGYGWQYNKIKWKQDSE